MQGQDMPDPERNSVRTRSLHNSVKRANEALEKNSQQPIPADITFHALRRTYAALRAELGEHPARLSRSS